MIFLGWRPSLKDENLWVLFALFIKASSIFGH
jgi:hypothetical protein